MNKKQRKELQKAIQHLKDADGVLQSVLSEEEEKFDTFSEYFPDTERAETSEAAIENMENAAEQIADAIASIEEITGEGTSG